MKIKKSAVLYILIQLTAKDFQIGVCLNFGKEEGINIIVLNNLNSLVYLVHRIAKCLGSNEK